MKGKLFQKKGPELYLFLGVYYYHVNKFRFSSIAPESRRKQQGDRGLSELVVLELFRGRRKPFSCTFRLELFPTEDFTFLSQFIQKSRNLKPKNGQFSENSDHFSEPTSFFGRVFGTVAVAVGTPPAPHLWPLRGPPRPPFAWALPSELSPSPLRASKIIGKIDG